MRVTIHQPEHLPWLGFWQKLAASEMLVILDDVQFKRRHFECRNKIARNGEAQWLTVPTVKCPRATPISAVRIDQQEPWQSRNLEAVHRAYARSPFFEAVFAEFAELYGTPADSLLELNRRLIDWVVHRCGLRLQVAAQSALNTRTSGSELIEEICTGVGATVYVSGLSGADYLDLSAFERREVAVEFIRYKDFYTSIEGENLCILDYLFEFGYAELAPYLRG